MFIINPYRFASAPASHWSANGATLDAGDDYAIGVWKLADESDSKGSFTLTNVGSVTFASGKSGNGAVFGTGKQLYAAHNAAFNLGGGGANQYMISTWYYAEGTPGSDAGLFQHEKASANYEGWAIYHQGTSNKVKFVNYSGADYTINLATTSTISNSVWHHLMVVNNGTTQKLYLDGSEEASSASVAITAVTVELYMNQNQGAWMATNSMLDEAVIWVGYSNNSYPAAIWNSGTGAFWSP